jgi:hypothetical protein
VEAEDQVGAGEKLHLLDDLVVSRIGEDQLVGPVGEGVRSGRGDRMPLPRGQPDDLRPRLFDVPADFPMSLQMLVPSSMTDWCIWADGSFKRRLPSSSICWTWERSCRVSGRDLELFLDAE